LTFFARYYVRVDNSAYSDMWVRLFTSMGQCCLLCMPNYVFVIHPSLFTHLRTAYIELDVLRLVFSRCCGKSTIPISSLWTRSVH